MIYATPKHKQPDGIASMVAGEGYFGDLLLGGSSRDFRESYWWRYEVQWEQFGEKGTITDTGEMFSNIVQSCYWYMKDSDGI